MRCWRKAGILSASENATINNEVGSASLPKKEKTISDKYFINLCSMLGILEKITCAIAESGNVQPPSLVDSIADEHGRKLSVQDFSSIVTNWVSIEENHVIQEMEV